MSLRFAVRRAPVVVLLACLSLLLTPAVAAGAPAAEGMRVVFGWPLQPQPEVTRTFDLPPQRWLPGHRGVDLAGTDRQPVLAAGDGVVAFAGMVAGRPVVSIDHPNGIRTTYEPVTATVTRGQPVSRSDQIGLLITGHPECAVTVCLHWGARRGESYLDPLSLLQPRRVRLLPL